MVVQIWNLIGYFCRLSTQYRKEAWKGMIYPFGPWQHLSLPCSGKWERGLRMKQCSQSIGCNPRAGQRPGAHWLPPLEEKVAAPKEAAT